jgi:hypothetical protein
MGNDQKSYYWHHTANGDLKCPGRSRSVQLATSTATIEKGKSP